MMSSLTFDCIAAVCSNGGIGYKGGMPWPLLRTDMNFMKQKTITTEDTNKQNAVIMGRKTWNSIPLKFRPLKNRVNIVLSRKQSEEIPGVHMVATSLADAMSSIQTTPLSNQIESVYILGGSQVYKEAMDSACCNRLYITEVMGDFNSDTFFPPIDKSVFSVLDDHSDPLIPKGVLEENGVKFKFTVYQRKTEST